MQVEFIRNSPLLSQNYFCFSTFFPASFFKLSSFSMKKLIGFTKDLFYNTFPEDEDPEIIFQKRKQKAIKALKNTNNLNRKIFIDESIPKYKRTAIINVNNYNKNKRISLSNIFHSVFYNQWLTRKFNSIYSKSDLKILIGDFKQSYSNIKFNINFSCNPLIAIPRDIIQKIEFTSSTSYMIDIMRKYDKNFSLNNLENEVKGVFAQLLEYSKEENYEKMKLVSSESALALIKNEIKERKNKNFIFKYHKPFYVDKPFYDSCELLDEQSAVMRFTLTAQEYSEKLYYDKKKKKYCISKDKDLLENNQYIIEVIRNPVPKIKEIGHSYLITNFQRGECNTMLI